MSNKSTTCWDVAILRWYKKATQFRVIADESAIPSTDERLVCVFGEAVCDSRPTGAALELAGRIERFVLERGLVTEGLLRGTLGDGCDGRIWARVDSPNGVYRVCGASDAYLQAIAWAIRADTAVYSSLYCPQWAAERDRTRFPVGLPVIEWPEPDSARPLFHPLTLVFAD